MKNIKKLIFLFIAWMITGSSQSLAQAPSDWLVDKMPADLEMDYALSSLPPSLRDGATVYLLDPAKGYYLARKGNNGFSAYVERTDWARGEFVSDTYAALGFDSIGSSSLLPVFFDVAAMRATGKYTAMQIRDLVIKRVKDGTYKAPSKTGICYMLSPLLRTHLDQGITNMVMPHYMIYAPFVDDRDIGGGWIPGGHQQFIIGTGDVLDKAHAIFNYIGIAAGESEKAKIIEQNKSLLARLEAYKSILKVDLNYTMSHHH